MRLFDRRRSPLDETLIFRTHSMGLVQDATVLASSGYAKTSTALSLLSQLGNEKENLGTRISSCSEVAAQD